MRISGFERPNPDPSLRMEVFRRAGMVRQVPSPWQVFQGTLEMTPFVLSPDVTAESSYRRSVWAHPWVRQPFLLAHIGLDHFATGSGLKMSLPAICKHLQLTWHDGMPVFDLQVVQTHPDGLATLRRSFEALLEGVTPDARRQNRLARRLFPDPSAYYRQFTEPGGWIDRAEAFDYASAGEEEARIPVEFFSLVGFMEYCATAFPRTPAEVGWARVPAHLGRRVGRRARSQRASDGHSRNENTTATSRSRSST